MMRIIAGAHRGLRLAAPKDPATRPTSDRVRESLFSILSHLGQPGPDTRVLDLFAGTGALGLEALSRGAADATFIERSAPARKLIAENLARARRAHPILPHDATRLPDNTAAPFTLVFLDPPYGTSSAPPALASGAAAGWLAPAALVVIEDDAPVPPPFGFTPLDNRRYGGTWITILEAGGDIGPQPR